MAWTAPRTWSVSEVVTASIMNTHVRDNFDYLKGAPTIDGAPTFAAGQVNVKAASNNNNQIRFQNSAGTNKTAIGSDINTNTGVNTFEVYDLVASALRLIVADGGNLGLGVAAPQGRIHGFDALSGFIHWSYNGVDNTARTVIPNGTGDVVSGMRFMSMALCNDGTRQSAGGELLNNASFNIAQNGAATDILTLRVNADGSCDVRRSAGSTNTFKVGLWLLWL